VTNFRTKLVKAAAADPNTPSHHPLPPCTSNTSSQNINTWKTKRKLQSGELNAQSNASTFTTRVNFCIKYTQQELIFVLSITDVDIIQS